MSKIKSTRLAKALAKRASKKSNPSIHSEAYNPGEIEPRWQAVWDKKKIYSPNLDKAKRPFYNLMMFPYPSAEGMHVGNMYAFTGADVYGRFQRMQGKDVFEPIGLDGFGIHSENYAIKVGRHPKEQAKISEKNFYRQLKATGNGFDWTRKVETYDRKYYKWTQWLFIQLFKAGLAYRKKAPVNFCPSCKTVLADEQVVKGQKNVGKTRHDVYGKNVILGSPDESGTTPESKTDSGQARMTIELNVCERCGTEVEKRDLEQWFFRITKYADRLLANIDNLDWSEKVKIAQRQWIGKSEGARIYFPVIARKSKQSQINGIATSPRSVDMNVAPRNDKFLIEVFTTRVDTLYGATFLVLSPEHPFITSLLVKGEFEATRSHPFGLSPQGRRLAKLKRYVDEVKKKTKQERVAKEKGKTGVFSGLYAVNPVNNEKIPVWIADYALMDFGTGALFGDAHDERDVQFAKKYKIPLKATIITGDKELDKKILSLEECFTGYGTLIDSGPFSGLTSKEAIKKVVEWLIEHHSGGFETTYHLRDWLISRQRYWGPPIPMIYCEVCAKKGNSGFTLTKKSSTKEDYLVNLKADPLDGWPDTLNGNISQENKNVNSQFEKGVDSPGVEPGRFGVSSQPSRPAEPTPESVYKNDDEFVNDWNSAGWFTVPEKDLPVELPEVKDWKPKGTGKSPLANVESFVNTKCPNCGREARRETDVSDTFLDSSWYFLRYLATEFDNMPFPIKDIKILRYKDIKRRKDNASNILVSQYPSISHRLRWLPVNMYIGGAEHSVLHLLYSRFIIMALKDLRMIDFDEPFARFFAHGLLIKEGSKMSKSKGNVVIPDQYIKKYGADTLRLYLMFLGPFNQGGDFYDSGIEGMSRFLRRVWRLLQECIQYQVSSIKYKNERDNLDRVMHRTIKEVTQDLEGLRYNTAIAHIMEYYNALFEAYTRYKILDTKYCKTLVLLLAPFAPHMTEELWQGIESEIRNPFGLTQGRQESGNNRFSKVHNSKFMIHKSIHSQPWPKYEPKYLEEGDVTVVVQVNGKVRGTIQSQKSIPDSIGDNSQKYVEEMARKSDRVKKYLEGKVVKKVIYVEGKVINFVTD